MATSLISSFRPAVGALSLALLAGLFVTTTPVQSAPVTASPAISQSADFPSWRAGAPALRALTDYVADVTNAQSPHFIPVADRIAVFDIDGTLLSETTPFYFDWTAWVAHTAKAENANAADKAYAQAALTALAAGEALPRYQGGDLLTVWAQGFAGMSLAEFDAFVHDFSLTKNSKGIAFKDSFFKPMAEVVRYLEAHQFKVYAVTGADRLLMRNLLKDRLPIPPEQVIGSDVAIEVRGLSLDAERGSHYDYKKEDVLVRGAELRQNLHFNKVASIARDIGKQPVLSFGNSSGDWSMNLYTQQKNPHPTRVFMLLCDDEARAACPKRDLEKTKAHYAAENWIGISMKDEFAQLYFADPTK